MPQIGRMSDERQQGGRKWEKQREQPYPNRKAQIENANREASQPFPSASYCGRNETCNAGSGAEPVSTERIEHVLKPDGPALDDPSGPGHSERDQNKDGQTKPRPVKVTSGCYITHPGSVIRTNIFYPQGSEPDWPKANVLFFAGKPPVEDASRTGLDRERF